MEELPIMWCKVLIIMQMYPC